MNKKVGIIDSLVYFFNKNNVINKILREEKIKIISESNIDYTNDILMSALFAINQCQIDNPSKIFTKELYNKLLKKLEK